MAKDLTKGEITRNLLTLAVPTMIGFGAQMFYDLVDIFWIGRISAAAVAGVTVFSTLFWIVEALNEVIGASSVALISQAFGRKDPRATALAIEQTIAFKFVAAAVAAALTALLIKPLMSLFVGRDLVELGLEYGYVRLFFLPVMFSSYTVNTTLRCLGDAGTAMKIMLFTSLINIVLDPVLMFARIPYLNLPGLNLGVFGAALATIIAQSAAFALGFYVVFSGKKGAQPSLRRIFRLDRKISASLITIGLPSGLEILLRNLAGAVILGFVSAYGSAAITAAGIGGRIIGFLFMPLLGLSIGGSAMVGQSLGAGDLARAEKSGTTAGSLSFLAMLICTVFVFLGGRGVMGFFTQDAAVARYGLGYLRFSAVGLLFIGYALGLGSVFMGSGYNMPLLVAAVVSRWAVQIPFLLLAVHLLKWPIGWVWFSYALGDLGEMFTALYFYRVGKWRGKRVWPGQGPAGTPAQNGA